MSTGRPKYNENIHENKRVNESIRDVSTNCVAGKNSECALLFIFSKQNETK